MKKVVIIGAGIGGLATAIKLAQKNFDVTIYEKNSTAGGRCQSIFKDGHTFDVGPTMYLYPQIYEDFFASIGEDIKRLLTLIPSDPTYLLNFTDGTNLILSSNRLNMQSQLEQVESGSYKQFLKLMEIAKLHYEFSIEKMVKRNIKKPQDYFNLANLFQVIKLGGIKNHYKIISSFFKNANLRAAFTFQDSYLSMSPFEAPGVFSQLSYMELMYGNFLPKGGMHKIIDVLEKIALKNKVTILYNSPVNKINIKNNKAESINLSSGKKIKADYIVVNADLTYAYNKLLPKNKYSKKLLGKKYSCSAMGFHWGLDKAYLLLKTHNLFFSKNYKKSFSEVINQATPPSEPHFYIQAPTRTDPSRAPKNEDTLSVIIPINHIDPSEKIDWKSYQNKVRKYVIKRLNESGIKNINKHIKFEIPFLPTDWEEKLNLTYGSIYGLHHNLAQIGYLREKRQHKKFKNLYFVGASTHPGSGLPTVLLSSIFTSEDIIDGSSNN